MATGNTSRATAFSAQLAQAHNTLRTQLRRVQQDLGSPSTKDRMLQQHCLAFCAALTNHHEAEDTGLFAELLAARPDLESVVDNLVEDHHLIAGILAGVDTLAREAAEATPERRQKISQELDGLAAIMESHFSYEERAISAAIDGIEDTGWADRVFRPA